METKLNQPVAPLKSFTEIKEVRVEEPPKEAPKPEPPAEPVFAIGDRVALVGTVIACDSSFGRYTVEMDKPLVGDNPFNLTVYARNLRKEP